MKPVVDRLRERFGEQIDFTVYAEVNDDAEAGRFADSHGVTGIPAMMLVSSDGTELQRWLGSRPEDVLAEAMEDAVR